MGIEAMQVMNIVKSLPLSEKFYIIELIFKDLREQTIKIEREEGKRKKQLNYFWQITKMMKN